MIRFIPLTRGQSALVDDEWYDDLVGRGAWFCDSKRTVRYAARNEKQSSGLWRLSYMHIVVWMLAGRDVPDGLFIDHRDQNGLNNRLSNLRLATHAQNMQNRRKKKDTHALYKGVWWHAQRQKWVAYLGRKYLGVFPEQADAARAYDKAAVEKYGSFASLNFPS